MRKIFNAFNDRPVELKTSATM